MINAKLVMCFNSMNYVGIAFLGMRGAVGANPGSLSTVNEGSTSYALSQMTRRVSRQCGRSNGGLVVTHISK